MILMYNYIVNQVWAEYIMCILYIPRSNYIAMYTNYIFYRAVGLRFSESMDRSLCHSEQGRLAVHSSCKDQMRALPHRGAGAASLCAKQKGNSSSLDVGCTVEPPGFPSCCIMFHHGTSPVRSRIGKLL